jgi:NodT family efflux transporter outer membrane factor (OMF) lipoprotein
VARCVKYLSVAAILVSGCAVGPDFEKPAAPSVSSYTANPISIASSSSRIAGGGAQTLVSGEDISAEWWKLFQSKPLDDLIERSLAANPNLKAAQAALKVAQENTLAQYGAYYPSISGSASASHQKTSSQLQPTPNSGALIYNLYTPQLSISYAPDIFGLNARTVESLKAEEQEAHFALIATNITLSSNVVAAAIQEASLRQQIAATRESIAINNDMLKILRNQFAKGSISRLDVAAQESQLAQMEAALPPLVAQLAQQRDLLAVLAGGFPSDKLDETFELSNLTLPDKLPLSLPSQLVEQRPDVKQAEENLHAASAEIGVAVANRLPNLTLTADAGEMALAFRQMSGAGFWTLAGGITQPIFDGGTLLHRERAARAAYTEAAEQYRGTVLSAFQNVADTLNALEQAAHTLNAAIAAKDAAKVTLDLTRRQLQSGSVNYLTVLNAEQGYQQATIALIQAQAARFTDTAALFQALGGGWWNAPKVEVAEK